MNIYQILVILLLFVPFLIDSIVEILNVKAISTTIPTEFKGIYSEEKYKKSQEYLRVNTKFGLIQSSLSFILLVVFLVSGGFNFLDIVARNWGATYLSQGLIFAGLILLLETFISLPFSVYETFVIEEKFGFNKSTYKTFAKDVVTNLLLTVILGGAIFATLLWLFFSFGPNIWIVAWIVVALIEIFILFISPAYIMPLFNKFVPLKQGKLRTEIENFARKERFALQGIYTMDGSKRSTKSNAFFAGIGKLRRIVLFDTLIKQHTTAELVAVLAHEIGHYKKGHILKLLGISIVIMGITFWIVSLLINNPIIFQAFGVNQVSIYGSLIFIFILISPLFELVGVLNNIASRKFEFQADKYAVDSYGHKADFINALKKLSVNNLSNLTPHPAKVFKDYSHPPVLERIIAVKKIR